MLRGHRTLIDLPFIPLQLSEEISHHPVAHRLGIREKADALFEWLASLSLSEISASYSGI
jgi:hypothetical protein